MIQIIGTSGTSEYRAAEKIKRAFEDFLGDSGVRRSDIRIVVSAKTYGEKRQDIDLIVAGKLATAVPIPKSSVVKLDALLLSFFLTIEVKDHPPNKLSFSGPKVFVTYKERREDASEQAEDQKYSAKNYIEKHGLDAPYIVSILLLNNCPNELLPKSRHNILSGDFNAQELLEIIYIAYERRLAPDRKLIQAFTQRYASDYLGVVNVFTEKLEATQLDRKRIEVITRNNFDDKKYASELGKQLLVISGAGGTGKTVTLLQLAHYVYQERNAKALILTYNLALVSDIRRLMALMGMSEDIATSKVAISTVHSFMYKVLDSVGMNPGANDQFLRKYTELKAELLEMMGAINKSDVELWDYVFIDEGQDWPEDERDIIFGLYGIPNIVVAEGRAQLVRSQSICDWTTYQSIRVKSGYAKFIKSLRMKHDQCIFVSKVFEELEISDWKIEPNLDIFGGSVIVVIGDMTVQQDLISELINAAKRDGNHEVDLFFCVPPSFVSKREIKRVNRFGNDETISQKFTPLADTIRSWGYSVWDGVDKEERQSFPTKIDQLRLVQYDSCRGLEGWTVVNFAIDELYDYKKEEYQPTASEKSDFLYDHNIAADRFAKKWLAIPMTRAIDTLVLNVRNPNHWLAQSLKAMSHGSSAVRVIECKQSAR